MWLRELGLREWVALAVLGVALVLGGSYYFVHDSGGAGTVPPQATPTSLALSAPWLLTWTAISPGGDIAVVKQDEAQSLDLRFEGAPFPEVNDDGWAVIASTSFQGSPGSYALSVSYRGEISVSINGDDRKVTPPVGEATLPFAFDLADGETKRFVVRLRDAGGEARLAVRVVKRR